MSCPTAKLSIERGRFSAPQSIHRITIGTDGNFYGFNWNYGALDPASTEGQTVQYIETDSINRAIAYFGGSTIGEAGKLRGAYSINLYFYNDAGDLEIQAYVSWTVNRYLRTATALKDWMVANVGNTFTLVIDHDGVKAPALNFNATVSIECGIKEPIWESSVMTVGVGVDEVTMAGFSASPEVSFGNITPLKIFGQDVEYLSVDQSNTIYFKWVWPAPDYPPTILVRFNDYSDDPFALVGDDGVWFLQVPQAFTDWLTALDGQDTPFEIAMMGTET